MGTPSKRERSLSVRPALVGRARLGQGPVVGSLEIGIDLRFDLVRPRDQGPGDVLGRELLCLQTLCQLGRGQPVQFAHASSMMRGTLKRPSSLAGAFLKSLLGLQGRLDLVLSQDVLQRDRVRGGLDPIEIEGLDPLGVLEDVTELDPHPLTLLVRQIEARQTRYVVDRCSIDCHEPHPRGGRNPPTSLSRVARSCYRACMAFPKRLLADHERLVLDLRPHWVALVAPIAWILLAIAVYGTYVVGADKAGPGAVEWVVIGLAVLLIVWKGVHPIIEWATINFVLTSDRLITRSGIIAKQSKEIPLERINDVTFNQSILERMVGSGDLMIESAGERGQNRISNVRNPEQVQLTIYKEVEENNNRMMRPQGAPVAAPSGDSVTDQLEALGRLKEQGVITDMEFENKKQELLKRL